MMPSTTESRGDEILQAIATLSQSGVRISVEQIHGREDLLTQLVELTTEFRAATEHLVRLNGAVARRLTLGASLYQILQILSVTLFEKTPILQALQASDSENDSPDADNQLILFDF
jgi:hypothetical protein